jgi:hypothetical protein
MIRASADPAPLAGLGVEVVHGDILDAAAVDAAVAGCGRVYHTAAGFLMWSRDPEREIIGASVDGTRHVMRAAARAGVEKVLLREHQRHHRLRRDAGSFADRGRPQHHAAHVLLQGEDRGRARGVSRSVPPRNCPSPRSIPASSSGRASGGRANRRDRSWTS